ncbi:MAG: hypothetical protein L0Y72_20650 [Gemmataceae bacterium]|nr:hypothetical protein [Gemmataceae bacterium]MCI0741450.1 hypothetical protein [Gemmataceae bacterium]
MTSESCPRCGFAIRHRRKDGRCVSCGKNLLPDSVPKVLSTLVALKQDSPAAASQVEKDVRAFLIQKVAEGFHDDRAIIDQAVALFVGEEAHIPSYLSFRLEPEYAKKEVSRVAKRITAELLQKYRRMESQWGGPTDCDLLDLVFEELNRHGIIARQNLPCCNTCALAEIKIQMEATILSGKVVRGFVFYHEQDTGQAPHGELFLSFGAAEDGKEETVGVGQKIVEELTRAGLKAAWNNKADERIVLLLTWRKRRFSQCP